MNNDLTLGDKGRELIQSFEQCKLSAYMPTGEDVPTIGWGHTRAVAMGDTCTQEQADAWFAEDVKWAEDCVNRAVTVALSQGEADALISLCFNIGCKAFSGSTLVKMLNTGNYTGARDQFKVWDRQKGKELAGLTRRRAAEAALFEESFS